MEEHEEIEVIDVSMTEEEIDQMIAHLVDLKEHKTNVQFPIAADVDLSVTFDHDEHSESENLQDTKVQEKTEDKK